MENLNLDIQYFVLTGNFCNIDFGITKDKLISIGLIPDDWINEKTIEDSTLWKFGNIEFYFDDSNKLISIFSDKVGKKIDGGKKININNYWILNKKKTLQKTIKELLKLKLDFEKNFINPGYIKLKLTNGVYFYFDFSKDLDENHNIWTMTAIGKENNLV